MRHLVRSAIPLTWTIGFLLVFPALAQPPTSDPTAQREAIAKLGFLIGEWRGEGWAAMGPESRQTFQSWELVQPKLGGTVLLIEGLHKRQEGDEEIVVHEAMAVVSWDEDEGRYRFSSYLVNGRSGTWPGWIEGDAFVWSPGTPGSRQIRYTIRLDEEGRWFEVGEISGDGETWRQFFEMRLERAKD